MQANISTMHRYIKGNLHPSPIRTYSNIRNASSKYERQSKKNFRTITIYSPTYVGGIIKLHSQYYNKVNHRLVHKGDTYNLYCD